MTETYYDLIEIDVGKLPERVPSSRRTAQTLDRSSSAFLAEPSPE
jgi:hypothetical protein